MTRPATQFSDPKALETRREGSRIFFTRDVQPVFLEACRRQQIGFDAFAARMGSNRAAMVLILKGQDAVSPTMLGLLRDFVDAARQQPAPGGSGMSTAT